MKSLVNTVKVRKLLERIEGNKLILSDYGRRWRKPPVWLWDVKRDLVAAEKELKELTG